MKTRMGLALAVMMAMALGHVKESREELRMHGGANENGSCLKVRKQEMVSL